MSYDHSIMTVRRTKLDLVAWFSLPLLVTQYKYTLICGCGWLLMFMPLVTSFNLDGLTQMNSTGFVSPLVFRVVLVVLFLAERLSFELALLGGIVVLGGLIGWGIDVENQRIAEMGAAGKVEQS